MLTCNHTTLYCQQVGPFNRRFAFYTEDGDRQLAFVSKMHLLPLIPSLSFEPTDCVFQPIENWALYQIMFAAMYIKQCQRFIFSLTLSLVSHSKGYVGTLCPLLLPSNSLEHDGLLLMVMVMVMVMVSPADSACAASARHPTVVSTPHQSTSTSTWSKDPISELL